MAGISIPSSLDTYIRAGIEKGKNAQRTQFWKKSWRIFTAAAAVLLLFTFSVRLSPAFAKTIREVPGLSYFVQLINGDPSIQEAISNNYIQKLGLSQTHHNVTVTLDSMVADRHRIVIFYKVLSVKDQSDKKAGLLNVRLYDRLNHLLPVAIGYDSSFSTEKGSNLHELDIDILDCKDRQLTNPLILKISQNGQAWSFKLPFDLKKLNRLKQVYPLHQTVSLEGQKLTVNSVTIYPTGSAVDVSYDPSNTKQITNLDDLHLVDDQGNTYATVKNGILASGSAESNHQVLFLDSNYFTKPKSLHLELTSARALDKTEEDVVVSLKNKKLLKAPKDHLLSLNMISGEKQSPNGRVMDFTIKLPKIDQEHSYQLFTDEFKDGSGRNYQIDSWEESSDDTGKTLSHTEFVIPKREYTDPLTFHLIDYPTRIHGKVDLKIK